MGKCPPPPPAERRPHPSSPLYPRGGERGRGGRGGGGGGRRNDEPEGTSSRGSLITPRTWSACENSPWPRPRRMCAAR
eukprot:9478746-Pyramimonas_sp.AAC.1